MTHTPDHYDDAPVLDELRRTSVPGNVIRGGLIGVVETVPGVSGGTVALVVGIYRQLIDSASAIVSGVRALITGPDRAQHFREQMALVHWSVVIPVMIGMPIGLFTAVQFIGDWVENYPELTRAAFFGMVLVSLAVPYRMARDSASGTLAVKHWIIGLAAAAVTFVLVSLPPGQVEPHWWIVLPAAAVAVSALLLPGLSGSFLLLTFGLYQPTIAAARDLDLGYLAVFFAGLLIGLVSIVKGLKWLLDHHHTVTMVVLAGVMLGALRTLWPWQTEDRGLLAPDELLAPAAGLAAAGAGIVALLLVLDRRLSRHQQHR
ncbi:DUF368 domain-containing protein [Nesterenkonia ebinurensis]|uniref:DUF368 domain-containing protein n=1 Tax=Nesterenkonia ebinurensis TaxID=2608252 RepID=UPI00123CE57D|nr:DUF368 domain-containing protein [Nesterenkonia ebinurensis]